MNHNSAESTLRTPHITRLQVIPVAGRDSMLLHLSGAHGPFFTRNIVILEDSDGHTGVGEVPGGEAIRKTIDDARGIVVGQSIGNLQAMLNRVRSTFAGFALAAFLQILRDLARDVLADVQQQRSEFVFVSLSHVHPKSRAYRGGSHALQRSKYGPAPRGHAT